MLHIAGPVKEFILNQAPDVQQEILQAFRTIEARPLSGAYLPFPYVPGLLGYPTGRFFITYRLSDDIPEIASVVRMPTVEDIQRALEERLQDM